MLRVGGYLVALLGHHFAELCKGSPVRFVSPDAEGRAVHGIDAGPDQGTVVVVLRGTDSHVVTDLNSVTPSRRRRRCRSLPSRRCENPGVLGKVSVFIHRRFGLSQCRPDAVVVDARVEVRDDDFARAGFRHGHDLFLKGSRGISEPFISQCPCVHFFGERSELRQSAHVKKLGCSGYQLCFLLQ